MVAAEYLLRAAGTAGFLLGMGPPIVVVVAAAAALSVAVVALALPCTAALVYTAQNKDKQSLQSLFFSAQGHLGLSLSKNRTQPTALSLHSFGVAQLNCYAGTWAKKSKVLNSAREAVVVAAAVGAAVGAAAVVAQD